MRLAALALALALPAGAAPIVDQESTWDGGTLWHDNDSRGTQTFTVETSGTLVRLELLVTANVGLRGCVSEDGDEFFCGVVITSPRGGTGSQFLDPDPGWMDLPLPPLAVQAGDVLTLVIQHEGILGFGRATYPAGLLTHVCGIDPCIDPLVGDRFNPLPGDTVMVLDFDYVFRAWVEPNAVPEPAALALVVLGLVVAARAHSSSTPGS